MTAYGTYDAGLPCKNKNCKSHGKPHPNCRCYGGMAEGGDVTPYCGKEQPHRRGCKYFADGGEVHDLDVPEHQDPILSVSAYISQGGLHSLINGPSKSPAEELDKYNMGVNRGNRLLDSKTDALFSGKKIEPQDVTRGKKVIGDWLDRGGVTADIKDEIHKQNAPLMLAGGGDVKPQQGISPRGLGAAVYPQQNALLQETKGRVSDYLNGLKPQATTPKLAFDSEPDDRLKKKSYESALHTAAHPTRILDEIQKGTITPEHMEHFVGLYPGLHDVLQKKLTKKITEYQIEGKKPPRNVRQGLSLFMGVALSGELSPQNMQSVQAVFQGTKAQKQQQGSGTSQKKTSALEKADDSYMTANQAAASRQQKQ